MPTIWRLCDARWASTALSGQGAALYPGRWNSAGRRAVYCAATRSLAALELLAHIEDRALLARACFIAMPLDVSDDQIQLLRRLPEDWDRLPPGDATRSLGDRFLENARHPVLRVPSAVVQGEFNYLLNPLHPDFHLLRQGKPEPFAFDTRLASTVAAPAPSAPGKASKTAKPPATKPSSSRKASAKPKP